MEERIFKKRFSCVSSNRRFNAFGMKFLVEDLPSGAKERKEQGFKYCRSLIIDNEGRKKIVHDKITLEVPHFNTIKDAHRWVKFMSGEGDFIDTW